MNERVRKLRQASLDTKPWVSPERAEMMTEFDRHSGEISTPVRRALAFKYLMENKTIYLGDGELIVGERGPAPKGTPTYHDRGLERYSRVLWNPAREERVAFLTHGERESIRNISNRRENRSQALPVTQIYAGNYGVHLTTLRLSTLLTRRHSSSDLPIQGGRGDSLPDKESP